MLSHNLGSTLSLIPLTLFSSVRIGSACVFVCVCQALRCLLVDMERDWHRQFLTDCSCVADTDAYMQTPPMNDSSCMPGLGCYCYNVAFRRFSSNPMRPLALDLWVEFFFLLVLHSDVENFPFGIALSLIRCLIVFLSHRYAFADAAKARLASACWHRVILKHFNISSKRCSPPWKSLLEFYKTHSCW